MTTSTGASLPVLFWARDWAMHVASINGLVTIDDIRKAHTPLCPQPSHYNAWGGVFAGPEWQRVGTMRTKRPHRRGPNRSITVGVWRYTG